MRKSTGLTKKLHLAIDVINRDILVVDKFSDGKTLSNLIRTLRRNIDRITGDDVYEKYEEV